MATRKPPARKSTVKKEKANPSPEEVWKLIAEAAYYRAEKRGFAHGMALDDWLEAEKEIDALTRAAV